jgi:CO/xanthine dehydrogenase Mo-binding subunit
MEIEGEEFYGEYEGVTDPINSPKENPISHIAYSYATQVVILDEEGKLNKVIAAHDVGRAINPINVEGQIEGGIVMGLGYALTEDYPLVNSVPTAKFGTLGLFRATEIPSIESLIIEKNNTYSIISSPENIFTKFLIRASEYDLKPENFETLNM